MVAWQEALALCVGGGLVGGWAVGQAENTPTSPPPFHPSPFSPPALALKPQNLCWTWTFVCLFIFVCLLYHCLVAVGDGGWCDAMEKHPPLPPATLLHL